MKRFFKKKANKETNFVDHQDKKFVDPREARYPSENNDFPKLTNVELVYDGKPDSFSVGVGDWEDKDAGIQKQRMLLMRWNGNGPEDVKSNRGFPIHGTDRPSWFPIPHLFASVIIDRLRQDIDERESVGNILDWYGFENLEKIGPSDS